MKKMSLSMLVLVIMTSYNQSFAQTEKGSSYSGPGFGMSYSYSSSKGSHYNTISQNAYISTGFWTGHFVADNLAIGPGFGVGYQWYKYTSGDYYRKSIGLSIGLSPFIRYYFGNNQKTKLFIQADGGIFYGVSFDEYTSWDGIQYSIKQDQSNNLSAHAGIALGIAYFINKVIGIESSLSYSYSYNQYSQNSDLDSKTNNHALGIRIGIAYYFAKSKKEKSR